MRTERWLPPSLWNHKKEIVLFPNHPIYGILSKQPRQRETPCVTCSGPHSSWSPPTDGVHGTQGNPPRKDAHPPSPDSGPPRAGVPGFHSGRPGRDALPALRSPWGPAEGGGCSFPHCCGSLTRASGSPMAHVRGQRWGWSNHPSVHSFRRRESQLFRKAV